MRWIHLWACNVGEGWLRTAARCQYGSYSIHAYLAFATSTAQQQEAERDPVQVPSFAARHLALWPSFVFVELSTRKTESDGSMNSPLPSSIILDLMEPLSLSRRCQKPGWGDVVATGIITVFVIPVRLRRLRTQLKFCLCTPTRCEADEMHMFYVNNHHGDISTYMSRVPRTKCPKSLGHSRVDITRRH